MIVLTKYPVADCQSNGCVPYLFATPNKGFEECFAQAQLSPTAISVSRIFTMLENEKESLLHFLCKPDCDNHVIVSLRDESRGAKI